MAGKIKDKTPNPNIRYVGTLKKVEGSKGTFLKFQAENPYSKTKDGEPNKYHKGDLVWIDKETGSLYKILSASVYDARENTRGVLKNIVIDLEDEYHVAKGKSKK